MAWPEAAANSSSKPQIRQIEATGTFHITCTDHHRRVVISSSAPFQYVDRRLKHCRPPAALNRHPQLNEEVDVDGIVLFFEIACHLHPRLDLAVVPDGMLCCLPAFPLSRSRSETQSYQLHNLDTNHDFLKIFPDFSGHPRSMYDDPICETCSRLCGAFDITGRIKQCSVRNPQPPRTKVSLPLPPCQDVPAERRTPGEECVLPVHRITCEA